MKIILKLLLVTMFFYQVFQKETLAEEVSDPLETVNRKIFWFNEQVDKYFFKPVAEGYDIIIPKGAQRSVDNFFKNLRTPILLVSDLVQLKLPQAGTHAGRFLINTTVGVGGLLDPASSFGIKDHYEDFGTALGYYGVGEGFYIVIPFLGPSNMRDAFGRLIDAGLNPIFHASTLGVADDASLSVSTGSYLLDSINSRAAALEALDAAKEASLDYYLFIRSAYYQRRQNQIHDNNPPLEDEFEEDVE